MTETIDIRKLQLSPRMRSVLMDAVKNGRGVEGLDAVNANFPTGEALRRRGLAYREESQLFNRFNQLLRSDRAWRDWPLTPLGVQVGRQLVAEAKDE